MRTGKPVIVAAAIKKDDVVLCGVRHGDPIMCSQLELVGWDNYCNAEQSFVTNEFCKETGMFKFVGREEGLAIARASGQVLEDHDKKYMLFSEDLW